MHCAQLEPRNATPAGARLATVKVAPRAEIPAVHATDVRSAPVQGLCDAIATRIPLDSRKQLLAILAQQLEALKDTVVASWKKKMKACGFVWLEYVYATLKAAAESIKQSSPTSKGGFKFDIGDGLDVAKFCHAWSWLAPLCLYPLDESPRFIWATAEQTEHSVPVPPCSSSRGQHATRRRNRLRCAMSCPDKHVVS